MRRNAWSHDVFSAALVPGGTRELPGNGNPGDTLLSSRLPSVDTVIGGEGERDEHVDRGADHLGLRELPGHHRVGAQALHRLRHVEVLTYAAGGAPRSRTTAAR